MMTYDKEESSQSLITHTNSQVIDSNLKGSIGNRARQSSEKNFEAKSAKILNGLHKRILLASSKGLWRVQIPLPRSTWTLDKENQRRLLERLKEGEVAAWINPTPTSIVIIVSWSQPDIERSGEEKCPYVFEKAEVEEKEIKIQDKDSDLLTRENKDPLVLALLPATSFETEGTGDEDASSENEVDKKKAKKLAEKRSKKMQDKEEFRRLKLENKEAKQREKAALKQSRKEERLRLKEKKKENLKKKEDKLRKKELREEKRLAKEKKKDGKKDKPKKKGQEKKKKESSSSSSCEEERTWSQSDLSGSSDSECSSD
jgi:hypothetical protein